MPNTVALHSTITNAILACHDASPCLFSRNAPDFAAGSISAALRMQAAKWRVLKQNDTARQVILRQCNQQQTDVVVRVLSQINLVPQVPLSWDGEQALVRAQEHQPASRPAVDPTIAKEVAPAVTEGALVQDVPQKSRPVFVTSLVDSWIESLPLDDIADLCDTVKISDGDHHWESRTSMPVPVIEICDSPSEHPDQCEANDFSADLKDAVNNQVPLCAGWHSISKQAKRKCTAASTTEQVTKVSKTKKAPSTTSAVETQQNDEESQPCLKMTKRNVYSRAYHKACLVAKSKDMPEDELKAFARAAAHKAVSECKLFSSKST